VREIEGERERGRGAKEKRGTEREGWEALQHGDHHGAPASLLEAPSYPHRTDSLWRRVTGRARGTTQACLRKLVTAAVMSAWLAAREQLS